MTKKQKSVTIDAGKLRLYITEELKISLAKFSYMIGKADTYITGLGKGQKEIPEAVYHLICDKCGVSHEFFLLEPDKQNPKSSHTAIALKNLVQMCDEITKMLMNTGNMLQEIMEQQQAMMKKVSANTLQLERIKDSTGRMSETDYEKAERFLKDSLADGDRIGTDILNEADARGIKRSELMKAKNSLGIINYTTGCGKSQKAWWGNDAKRS